MSSKKAAQTTEIPRSPLWRKLEELMRRFRLKPAELSRLAGVSRATLYEIRGGRTSSPDTLRQIARGLATDPFDPSPPEASTEDALFAELLAAAHFPADMPTPSSTRPRPVEDLTDDEVREALTRISRDPKFSAEFLSVAEEWPDMAPEAQRFLLNGFQAALQMDRAIKAAEQRDAAPSRQPRS